MFQWNQAWTKECRTKSSCPQMLCWVLYNYMQESKTGLGSSLYFIPSLVSGPQTFLEGRADGEAYCSVRGELLFSFVPSFFVSFFFSRSAWLNIDGTGFGSVLVPCLRPLFFHNDKSISSCLLGRKLSESSPCDATLVEDLLVAGSLQQPARHIGLRGNSYANQVLFLPHSFLLLFSCFTTKQHVVFDCYLQLALPKKWYGD